MVITSPFSSVKGYVVSKPPLVLFTLCLMGFAITTFSFAYYVEHNEKLPNLDAHSDLVSFLSHLSNRKFCISPINAPVIQTTNAKNATELENLTTIFVTAKLKSKYLYHNLTHVHGYISMSDWISECTTATVDKVKISFALPNNNMTEIDTEVCVMITGPVSVLASATNFNQCITSAAPHTVWGHIHKSSIEKYDFCMDEIIPLQHAELIYKPSDFNEVSLSTHDRSVINLHLFHTSYFLLVMVITLICYAMIRGKPITKHQSLDKVPLDV